MLLHLLPSASHFLLHEIRGIKFLFFFHCVYVSFCLTCMHMEAWDLLSGITLHSFSPLVIEARSLSNPELARMASSCTSLLWDSAASVSEAGAAGRPSGFDVVSGNLNLGPHACTAGGLTVSIFPA